MKAETSGGRAPSLANQIYARLKQDIFDFRLLPGDLSLIHISEPTRPY